MFNRGAMKRGFIAAALIASAVTVAMAGNTTLFSPITGDTVFPFTAPLKNGTAGLIDNMTIGATTPRAGTFTTITGTTSYSGPVAATTLSASGAVTGTGFTARLATPGPIGNTVASTGAFTTLNASGQITSTAGATTIASGACGTGSNGTIAGTNQSGLITIGASTTTVCTVAFSATLAAAPKACLLTPASAGGAAITVLAYVSSITTGGFVVTGSALTSTAFYYLCL